MRILIPALSLLIAACGSEPAPQQDSEPPTDRAGVHEAAEAFVADASAFDFPSIREEASPDFEILIFGQRLGLEEFEALMRGMQEGRDGRPLPDYPIEDFNTEIVGEVAYSTWSSPRGLESAVFVWSEGRWLIDRAALVPLEDDEAAEDDGAAP